MKKFLILSTIVSVGAATAVAAIDWNNTDNIAKGAEVMVSSKQNDAFLITDGNYGNRWQAITATHDYTQDWVIVDLGESKEFTDIEIKWEASRAATFNIYVSDEAIPYSAGTTANDIEYNKIDEDWLSAAVPFAECVTEGEDGDYISSLTRDGKGRYILVYSLTYNRNGENYGASIYELSVADIQGRDEASSMKINIAGSVVEGEKTEVNVDVLNAIGGVLDIEKAENLTLTCNDPEAVAITETAKGSYSVSGNKVGDYTLTATATYGDKELSATATFTVTFNWANVDNIITGDMPVYARIKADTDQPNPAKNAIDGDSETYYEYNGEWGGGDSWVIVDLGKEYVIEVVGADYKTGGGTYKYRFGTEGAELPEGDIVWGKNGAIEGWSEPTPSLSRAHNTINSYVLPTPVKARYVAVIDADNPNGKPQVKEIFVKGEEYATPVATTVTIGTDLNNLTIGETATLSADVFDQYGTVMENQKVVFYVDNVVLESNTFIADAAGEYTVTARCGEIESSRLTINVIAVSQKKLTDAAHTVTLNDEVIAKNIFTEEIQIPTLPSNLVINFGEEYDFELICLRWEAACPSDYTVTAADKNGNTKTILTVTGRGFVGGFNPVDRIAHKAAVSTNAPMRAHAAGNADLSGIKTLTITPTAKDHNWNLRLFGIDAYGATTNVSGVNDIAAEGATVDVYSLQGILLRRDVEAGCATEGLPAGLYIVGGKKVIVK